MSSQFASAQKVGLVLSGGGAKGMTHIGVIKALEENNIPIDYVAGTSMGAIVGGMYAMGMTTDEMITLLKSDDFKRWSTGEIEQKYIYYYKNADPTPAFFDLRFQLDFSNGLDSLTIKPHLPTNFISPVQMNYAFLELFMEANALANNNFDNLFIPFRCVASDVYNKEAVIFRGGDLGDAIRASMTFPFVFKPIQVDGRLLFDGGIFNNFPVDVMKEDFNPDFIFGSVVASDPEAPSIDNAYLQLQTMIMGHTKYSIPEEDGIVVQFDMKDQATFDFSKVDEFVELGYYGTMEQMDKIKERVSRQITEKELKDRRTSFCSKFPEPVFQNIHMTGIDSLQQTYVRKAFSTKNEKFGMKEFKEGYFKLISDDKIYEIIPHSHYNEQKGIYDLHLNVATEAHFKALIGGNVSSSISNQAYVGLQYQNLSDFAQTAYLDAQFGKIYNGLGVGTRIDVPTKRNLYLKANFLYHKYDYYVGNRFFYEDDRISDFSQNELFGKIRIGMPLTLKGRAEFGLGFAGLTDRYVQDREVRTELSEPDKSSYTIGSVFGQVESFMLNKVMYPTAGYHVNVNFQALYGQESFKSKNFPNRDVSNINDFWIQFKGKYEHYFSVVPRFTLGTHAEFAFSTRQFSQNYTATVIQAPAFEPTNHSRTVFNEAFSANRFVAAGIKPIFLITNSLQLRNETYGFLPYQAINRRADNTAAYSEPLTSFQYMSELSLVYDILKVASVSVFVNYYSQAASHWNFGINIGCLLFNDKFLK
ncbi:patatin [Paludibacter sp. 221]|nr:patatin [Paludibacter sp. 221]